MVPNVPIAMPKRDRYRALVHYLSMVSSEDWFLSSNKRGLFRIML